MSAISINGNTVDVSPHIATTTQLSFQDKDAIGSDYILIQTTGKPLDSKQKDELFDKKVNIGEYVSKNTYLCSYKESDLNPIRLLPFISYAGVYSPEFVVDKDLKSSDSSSEEVQVILHDDIYKNDLAKVADDIAKAVNVHTEQIKFEFGSGRIQIPTERLGNVARIDAVKYITRVPQARLLNNEARKILIPNPSTNVSQYKGEGEIVCVADTGFDTGDPEHCHDAFQNRVGKLYARGRPARRGRPGKVDDPDGHGTHVCGSVLGNGTSRINGGPIEAAASEATLHVQSVFDVFHPNPDAPNPNDPQALIAGLGGIRRLQDLFNEAYQGEARIHTNSWGSGPGKYEERAKEIDEYLSLHKDMVVLFAAGNEGTDAGTPDGKIDPFSIGGEASAKNCIAVGASENLRPDLLFGGGQPLRYGTFGREFAIAPLRADKVADNPDGLAAFSSRGPTQEIEEWQRFKPDVVAPGTCILSTRSSHIIAGRYNEFWGVPNDSKWAYEGGTSMACPLVAGCCAVIRGCWRKNRSGNPSAALIKALLINGAVEIRGQYIPSEIGPAPENNAGYGRVNLNNSLGSILPPGNERGDCGDGPELDDRDKKSHSWKITVPENSPRTLKVTLVWTDPAGSKLQNDLDLIVTARDGTTEMHGNKTGKLFVKNEEDLGNPASFDRQNNVEQVVWNGVDSGDYTVTVSVYHIATRHSSQPFAYAWRLF